MSARAHHDADLDRMIQEVLDGTADAATRRTVEARVTHDSEARERYRELEAVVSGLSTLDRVPFPRTVRRPRTAPRTRPVRRTRVAWIGVAVAAGIAAVVLVARPDLIGSGSPSAPATLIAGAPAADASWQGGGARVVATTRSDDDGFVLHLSADVTEGVEILRIDLETSDLIVRPAQADAGSITVLGAHGLRWQVPGTGTFTLAVPIALPSARPDDAFELRIQIRRGDAAGELRVPVEGPEISTNPDGLRR